jgi:hypothetical protein
MIEFKKEVKNYLPYDREQYISGNVKWYGVSFQLPGGFEGKNIGLSEYLKKYELWFKNLISKLDNGSFWIISHDRKGVDWFPNDSDNLIRLRTLFKQSNVPNIFKGALLFTKNDLLEFARDLISYPYSVFDEEGLFYDNLDVSNNELPLIIKITGHWDIHLLSTNTEFLREVVDANITNDFILKPYTGTSL